MTYTPPRRDAFVTFEEGHLYHGAEVTLSLDVATAVLFEMQDFATLTGAARAEMIRRFGDEVLVSWNLDDDADGDGLLAQPMAFVNAVLGEWIEAQGVDDPLVETSPASISSERESSTRRVMRSPSPQKRRAR